MKHKNAPEGKANMIGSAPAAVPDDETARQAVRTLIALTGDDPDRPGLRGTPEKVVAFYREFFTGYGRTAADYRAGAAPGLTCGDMILLRDIRLVSFCEHHMLPAAGSADIAYIPGGGVPGLGTVARIAMDCAARLTTQEQLAADIAAMLRQSFAPEGVAVHLRLSHGCMTLRGPQQTASSAVTVTFAGRFADDPALQDRFIALCGRALDPPGARPI